jgi:uncharacterized protein with HEPN domain
METPSPNSRLIDIVEAIAHSQADMAGVSLEAFETDWRRRWVVEHGIGIIAEASRRLPDEPRSRPGSPSMRGPGMKARHPEIPWRQVADIGNVLRHEYQRVAPDMLWRVVQDDLSPLDRVCLPRGAGGSRGLTVGMASCPARITKFTACGRLP